MVNAKEHVGHKLSGIRKRAKVTQRQLARALRYGSQQFVSNWERGIAYPPNKAIPTLARVLGVKPERIVKLIYAARLSDLKQERQAVLGQARRGEL